MVATILLTVAVGSKPVSAVDETSKHLVSLHQVDGSQPAPAQENPSEQTAVSALSLDAVVISLFSYHFSQYFLPSAQLATKFFEAKAIVFPARFSEPLFFFCYFQKVFGKQIVANAP